MGLENHLYLLLNLSKSFVYESLYINTLIQNSPLVISLSLIIDLPVVDLPHPDSPTKPNVSPLYNSNEIFSIALTSFFSCVKILL